MPRRYPPAAASFDGRCHGSEWLLVPGPSAGVERLRVDLGCLRLEALMNWIRIQRACALEDEPADISDIKHFIMISSLQSQPAKWSVQQRPSKSRSAAFLALAPPKSSAGPPMGRKSSFTEATLSMPIEPWDLVVFVVRAPDSDED